MLLSLVAFASCVAASPMDVPDPRPGHHVVDLTGTLTGADVEAIDAAATQASAGGELLVVVVDSTNGMAPREWATVLFNRLRLDTKERNRGVVLVAALKDRKAEIVVGEGYTGDFQRVTDSIMAGVVVANFKRGDPRAAMVEGARALTDRLIAPPPTLPPDAVADVAPPVEQPVVARVVSDEVEAAARTKAVKAVPDPRKAKGAVDLAKHLRPADQQAIAAARKEAAGIELVVVVVKSTGKLEPALFAEALAHRLQLDPERQRGVLLFAVAGADIIHIVTGTGFPASFLLTRRNEVVDQWRGNVEAGLTKRAEATATAARRLSTLGIDADQWAIWKAQSDAAAAREARMAEAAQRAEWAREAMASAPSEQADELPSDDLIKYGGGIAGLIGSGLLGREILRRRPRSCRKCRIRMHRLGEDADDEHLQAGERTEESLGSVDYDIWACGQCGEVLKTRWGAIFSSYSRCKGCSWRAMSSSSRTIRSATTSSTGLAEVTEDCKHCSYHNTYTRVIPRVQKSSSSSSSGGRSSGGGGFSSGRGSSGSW